MDIVCVEQPDGTFKSSPFHVRFGKLKLLKSARKTVTINVNGIDSEQVQLLLGMEGEAFFFREAQEGEVDDEIDNIVDSGDEQQINQDDQAAQIEEVEPEYVV